ncbi:DUF805 domain-containing protein [Acidocella sp.]|uniref:DUF805 domain-containing protein n=1 Tax=Acidocella sp. TaxID=50710 RepID=UPI0026114A95|nr:DUF805 domain-containing protein [Acidocella sp.]
MSRDLDSKPALWFSFQGYTSRNEFWVLGNVEAMALVVVALFGLLGLGKCAIFGYAPTHLPVLLTAGLDAALLCLLVSCTMPLFLFSPALTFRRLHDLNRSGWDDCCGTFRHRLLFAPGVQGASRFCPDPLANREAAL